MGTEQLLAIKGETKVDDFARPFNGSIIKMDFQVIRRNKPSIKYRVARGWSGRLKNGYRLGMLGILSRNEADVAASGIFQRINRHAEFDIIHQSWEFKSGFIYRITPQLASVSGAGNFFTPFRSSVWVASSVTTVLIVIVLKLVGLIVFKTYKHELNLSWAAYIVDVVGTISQQGIPSRISPRLSIKIALSSLLMMNLVMYNYYTSAVVGGLLSSPGRGPETVREIIDSALVLSFRDIGYHKILFRETTVPIIRELFEKKVKPSREDKQILPVYADVITAVRYLKHGGYAFHCEMTEAFQDIANQFDANEVCELRTAKGLFNDMRLMSFVLPKRSMYTEMFRITMMRVQEVGLIKRTLKIHKIEKPICQSGGRVHPVEFFGVSTAFGVLCVGTIVAAVLLIAERLSTRSPRKVIFLHTTIENA
ncbi:ionotropic receptor 75a-like [Ochlerotatus camptorhynchus]|uniref:ionotropic receptor 75a-like n=1 Tax=Ochlerotatus camptorhynchus TaxID=644619 RepID=UPI0031D1F9B6